MKKGFSLLETIIILAISMIFIILLAAILIISLKALSRGDQKAESTQNGYIVFDALSRELRQAKAIMTALPASELEFEDGHATFPISYIYYHIVGTDLVREQRRYYFLSDPSTYVHETDTDAFGNPPQLLTVATSTKAEFFQSLQFSSSASFITVDATVGQTQQTHLYTKIDGRNL